MTTDEAVVLLAANRWEIDNIVINPSAPSISYQVIARNGEREVQRTTVHAGGEELTADGSVVRLYRIIEKMLYADAQARGVIPAEAVEEPVEEPVTEEPVVPADGE